MIEVLRRICPYPTIDEQGNIYNGLQIKQPKTCKKCASKPCRNVLSIVSSEPYHQVCEFGYSVVSIPTVYGPLWINGVYVPFANAAMVSQRRKSNRSQKVPWKILLAYSKALSEANEPIQREFSKQVKESISTLHDIKTAVNVVLRNAEAIIASLPGQDDAERIDQAEPSLRALLKSVNLLNSRLCLVSIIANPESASYGQARRTPVYKLFHLMTRLFEEEGARRSIRIRMMGSSFNTPSLHDSFETIPLVLLDNAVKYANPNSEILVRVHDTDTAKGSCTAQVESLGQLIPRDLQPLIFQRGFRTPDAKTLASAGSGLGLYIAKVVAEANNCTITYEARALGSKMDFGYNTFTVNIN